MLAFRVDDRPEPALEVRVNFGVFAGRNATQAEIEELARSLRGLLGASFAVVAEERHEFGGAVDAAVRQIVIQSGDRGEELADEVVAAAESWATACIHARSDLGELGSEI